MWERLREWMPGNARVLVWSIALVAVLATAAFYAMGFAQAAAVHDVFHDFRHAAGLPCH